KTVLTWLVGGIALLGVIRSGFAAPPKEEDRPAKPSSTAKAPLYETDIQPLLQAKCLRCHGEKTRKAGLDLRTRTSLLKGSDSGLVVVPGKPMDSLLYQFVHDGKMPPDKKGRLTSAEVETLGRWIETGIRLEAPRSADSPAAVPRLTQHDILP